MRVSWSFVVPKRIIVCPSETKTSVIIASDVCDTIAVIHKWIHSYVVLYTPTSGIVVLATALQKRYRDGSQVLQGIFYMSSALGLYMHF